MDLEEDQTDDCEPIDPITDEDFERLYQQDQRKVYSGGYLYDCPDCGSPKSLTQEMKNRGYHCDACTRRTEQGW